MQRAHGPHRRPILISHYCSAHAKCAATAHALRKRAWNRFSVRGHPSVSDCQPPLRPRI